MIVFSHLKELNRNITFIECHLLMFQLCIEQFCLRCRARSNYLKIVGKRSLHVILNFIPNPFSHKKENGISLKILFTIFK